MPFAQFVKPEQTLAAYQCRLEYASLFEEAKHRSAEPWLEKLLAFAARHRKPSPGETYLREFVISPIFAAVLDSMPNLRLWADEFVFNLDERLCGVPDYLLTAVASPSEGYAPNPRPLLAVAEAKREDFQAGWGQCLAELMAVRLLNNSPEIPVWGIVTTGEIWQFGKLTGASFIQHNQSADLDPLEKLLGVLHYIFAECQAVAEQWAAEADGGINPSDKTN